MTSILITGVTGSFGRSFLKHTEDRTTWDILGIARGEARLEKLKSSGTRAVLLPRDCTDWAGLASLPPADYIVHAAALKRVSSSYENAEEYARVNIGGTINVARLAKQAGARLLFISSDKAVQAHNIYGATKRVGEGIVLAAGGSVVRGGNVWMSDGSVSQKFAAAVLVGKPAVLHDANATRFHLAMGFWVIFVLTCLLQMHGGEIFAPKLAAYGMGDLADAFHKMRGLGATQGKRQPGDKRHEYLFSPAEAPWVVETDWALVQGKGWQGAPLSLSGENSKDARRMTAAELEELVRQL